MNSRFSSIIQKSNVDVTRKLNAYFLRAIINANRRQSIGGKLQKKISSFWTQAFGNFSEIEKIQRESLKITENLFYTRGNMEIRKAAERDESKSTRVETSKISLKIHSPTTTDFLQLRFDRCTEIPKRVHSGIAL